MGSEVDCFHSLFYLVPQEKNFTVKLARRGLETYGEGVETAPPYVPAQFSTYDPDFVHADEQKMIKRRSMVNRENFNLLQRVQDH